MAGPPVANFALGGARGISGGLTAQAVRCASQRAAQSPVEVRMKGLDDGVWIISASLIQQALRMITSISVSRNSAEAVLRD
jgi:hypothetical protein